MMTESLDIFLLARAMGEDINAVRQWCKSMPWKLPPPVSWQRPLKWNPGTVRAWLTNRQANEDWAREAHRQARLGGGRVKPEMLN